MIIYSAFCDTEKKKGTRIANDLFYMFLYLLLLLAY